MKKIFLLLLLILPLVLDAQVITTFAGTGSTIYGGDGGQSTAAGIPDPAGGAFDKYGNYIFADGLGSKRISMMRKSPRP